MKLFKFDNKNIPICYYKTNKQVEVPNLYQQKTIRGFWVSNVLNIDLPNISDVSHYQNEVIKMLDTCKDYNLNTIFFQVRTTNDAFYESKLNPYSRYLTGKEGLKPPFDVFKWVISEAKKRNIMVHAWMNPYRVSLKIEGSRDAYLETLDDLNFAKINKDCVIVDKNNQLILNPAKNKVKEHIINTVKEVIENYQVDGVHFDDYFYPYAGLSDEYNDQDDFKNQVEFTDLGDFRRNNITDVIKGVYNLVKKHNKNLLFGVSPFGVWQNKANSILGSNTDPRCSQSYDNQYADSYLWVKNEYIDYIIPQLYWDFGHELAPFADLTLWWVDLVKKTKVDLYIGHGAYRYGTKGEYQNPLEVVNQVLYANQFSEVKGNVFFTYKTFIDTNLAKDGMKELKKLLRNERMTK